MKIAVYGIALNEEKFAERWAKSAAAADYRVVADTGSSDATIARLKAQGVAVTPVSVRPWRFDRARDVSLALVPTDADVCISLDMDEVLVDGWRPALELAWISGTTRLRYPYVWSWSADGKPKRGFYGEKIHARHGYRWSCPAHEILVPEAGFKEIVAWSEALRIHHHPDREKPRSQYLPLLALGAREEPGNARNAHYFGRELMFHRRWDEAIAELKRHLALPDATWRAERATSMRYIARCYAYLKQPVEAGAYLMRACAETPEAREPWLDLARHCAGVKDWLGGVWAVQRALAITQAPKDQVREERAWGAGPFDVGSVCAYHAGLLPLAREWLAKALTLEPANPNLIKNAGWILPAAKD